MKAFSDNLIYWYINNKVTLMCSTIFVLLFVFYAYYLFLTGATGEKIEHKGKVVGTSVLHSYGTPEQDISVKLNSGKVLRLQNIGKPINIGNTVIVVEMPRKGISSSNYFLK